MTDVMTFEDIYHHTVYFSFENQPFSHNPKHVWAICRFCNYWLLTEHPRRGWEFPGGKVENGETAEMAARREVFEETGAYVSSLSYVAQYKVTGKGGTIIKNVYFAQIGKIEDRHHYFETKGPVFLREWPTTFDNEKYSFMMKDGVLLKSMDYIERYFL